MPPGLRVDPRIEDGRPDDIVIALMGQTKAGKSSLINRLVGRDEMQVGVDMVSCTQELASTVLYPVPDHVPGLQDAVGGRRIVFLDTPGFDDTNAGDDEILIRISDWLEKSYRRGMHVGGVLYLHDTTKDGWTGASRKNLKLFSKICGDDRMNLVGFLTTKWSNLHDSQFENARRRISELKRKHWEPLITAGAQVYHLKPPTRDQRDIPGIELRDPWAIIYKMVDSLNRINPDERCALLLQDEIVNQDRFVVESQAGQEIQVSLAELLKRARAIQRATREGGLTDEDMVALQERQRQIDMLTEQLANLRPSLGRRIRRMLRRLGLPG